MKGDAPTLAEQALAVELAAVNHRGHCDNLRALVERGKRPQHELEQQLAKLPALEAAARTMKTVASEMVG